MATSNAPFLYHYLGLCIFVLICNGFMMHFNTVQSSAFQLVHNDINSAIQKEDYKQNHYIWIMDDTMAQ